MVAKWLQKLGDKVTGLIRLDVGQSINAALKFQAHIDRLALCRERNRRAIK